MKVKDMIEFLKTQDPEALIVNDSKDQKRIRELEEQVKALQVALWTEENKMARLHNLIDPPWEGMGS